MKATKMKSNLIAVIGIALIALLAITTRVNAQDTDSLAWTYAQLRGSWEYHTFEDRYTIVFRDDANMLFDKEAATYELTASSFRVNDGDNSSEYAYSIDHNSLTVTLPDGTTRRYSKEDAGKSEELVTGNYYAAADPSRPNATINFDGNGTFAFGTQGASSSSNRYGMYRVQGSQLILAFEDGSVGKAQIQLRDGDETVVRFTYLNRDFESANEQLAVSDPEPDPSPIVGDPPGMAMPIVVTMPVFIGGGGGYVSPHSVKSPAPANHNSSAPARSERGSGSNSTPAPSRDFGSVRTGSGRR